MAGRYGVEISSPRRRNDGSTFAGCASGALVVAEDEAAFAAAVVRLLSEPALRAELRERGRSYARAWSSATMARRLGEIYRALVQAPQAAQVARAAG